MLADAAGPPRPAATLTEQFKGGLPDPECVLGHGERELAKVCLPDRPPAGPGHSRRPAPVFLPLGRIPVRAAT